jgi:hypothetical protein
MDMLTVGFLQNFRERPLHLLGGLALALAAVGVVSMAAGHVAPVEGRSPLWLEIMGGSLIAGAVPLLGLGFLAEMIVHMFPPAGSTLPIIESLPDSDVTVTVGTSLTIVEGSGPGLSSSRGQRSREAR